MNYISTRGNYSIVQSAEAIALGMVPRGGLFVPETIPTLDINPLKGLTYNEIAFEVLSPFLTGTDKDYSADELRAFIKGAYQTDKFESDNPAPLHMLDDNIGILELWHGPTAAFKDMALQIMPYMMAAATKKIARTKETVILVATSGDTGKAALEGYKDVPGTRIIVFYPKDGVSRVQELQMLTTGGRNTSVVGVKGNFDDCQTMVKQMFSDVAYNNVLSQKGFALSSANSINWGRLAPQIVYYFWAYLQMVQNRKVYMGDPVNAVVPTGNFGNILAGYYAQQMGLPLKTMVCASNKNNVLSDFINTGTYDRKREFYKTASPSMDILISSNLERFLYELSNHNARKVNQWYSDLGSKGVFKVDDTTRQRMKNVLYGNYTSEEETLAQIKETFQKHHYMLDPHTAVGVNVYGKYLKDTGDTTPAFICGTASPYKFNLSVYQALTDDAELKDEMKITGKLHELSGMPIHRALNGLEDMKINHNRVISINQAPQVVLELLGAK